MGYEAEFKGWEKLTLLDILVAYKKVKADTFFENCFPTACKFSEYENDLQKNLEELLSNLKRSNNPLDETGLKDRLLGECRIIPKKLRIEKKKNSSNGHVYFSDGKQSFENLCQNHNLIPEFRIVGDFPVDTHIISALWVNMVGHKFDQCLDDCVYGSRLKRIRCDSLCISTNPQKFHITSIGSFQPYFCPYRKWRFDGFDAIRRALKCGQKIVAASLDLRSYYHLIDPTFITLEDFQKSIGIELNENEKKFTKQLANFLRDWGEKAEELAKSFEISPPIRTNKFSNGGLVLNLTASRIISNMLLHKFDRLIQKKVAPLHYGRYIDDIFLVVPDLQSIGNANDLMRYLTDRIGKKTKKNRVISKSKKQPWTINLDENYQGRSRIELQSYKIRLFMLSGQSGQDLIGSIEREIINLSSEIRLMPVPDQLNCSTASKVLLATGKSGEEANTLRRADGTAVLRLGWSLRFRQMETMSSDLPSREWKKQRNDFFEFAENHILRPDRIFEHYLSLPRLLSLAVSVNEWSRVKEIICLSFSALETLEKYSENKIFLNGDQLDISTGSQKSSPTDHLNEIWIRIKQSLALSFLDILARSYPLLSTTSRYSKSNVLSEKTIENEVSDIVKYLHDHSRPPNESTSSNPIQKFCEHVLLTFCSDLAKKPFKDQRSNFTKSISSKINDFNIKENQESAEKDNIKEFLKIEEVREILYPR